MSSSTRALGALVDWTCVMFGPPPAEKKAFRCLGLRLSHRNIGASV